MIWGYTCGGAVCYGVIPVVPCDMGLYLWCRVIWGYTCGAV